MCLIILCPLRVNIRTPENTILEITFNLCCFDLLFSRNAVTVKITHTKKNTQYYLKSYFIPCCNKANQIKRVRTQEEAQMTGDRVWIVFFYSSLAWAGSNWKC